MIRLLGVVPARADSRRLSGKNQRELGGIPLIAWTVRAALAAGCLDRVVVSTDSADIAAVAKEYGADAPRLRSEALAGDDAATVDVVVDVLSWYDSEFDAVVLLQPTSPFRTPSTIRAVTDAFSRAPETSVVTVGPVEKPVEWMRSLGPGDELADPGLASDVPLRRINGSVYVCPCDHLRRTGSLYTDPTRGFAMDDVIESLDIDTAEDWALAELYAQQRSPA